MTFGITTFRASGTPLLVPDGAGGLYIETWVQTASAPLTRSYTNLQGMTLRVFEVWSGCFTWVLGVDGNGAPMIVFSPPHGANGGTTGLLVFAA
ncbi:hypothetical protein [Janthinobacterium fluminis]|uniref:Uncharacterized protein n=1 Tax=Janthinobacterium fluminis TaxID=2987524 RepID=A0ABT5JXK5_9BURK|nr:hypothetical protein [Janthinobacterium fluminis]MDC8756267.1 hypothetical protein [Janthinobacterium fluminis]